MTTLEMEIRLMSYFDIRKTLIVPNVTPLSHLVGFEADLLVLSKSGFATAVEIKVSKSDLKADLKKKHIKAKEENWMKEDWGRKYYFGNLKYFTYAVPEFLEEAALEQIPEFCGLLVCKKVDYNNRYINETRFEIHTVRKPKMLFQTKWDDKMRYDLARLGTMRIQGLKELIINYKSK